MNLKVALVLGLIIGTQANADVVCSAIKKDLNGSVLRGVKITLSESRYSETVWFGTDSASRDQAGKACWEVVHSSRCEAETPKASDRYINAGDPGFGPRMMIENSTKAGRLYLSDVSSSVLPHVPSGYSKSNGKYFTFYDGCQEERAELAYSVVDHINDERISRGRERQLHLEPIHIYDKF